MSASSAATAATSSPTNRTRVSSTGRSAAMWPAGASKGVTVAYTPGNEAAADVSTASTSAWGCGLRTMRPYSMPGSFMSAV